MSGHTPLPAELIDLPMLPLRDVVVFPHMVIPLFVGRPKSIKALESAMLTDRRIMLVAQKTAAKDEPEAVELRIYIYKKCGIFFFWGGDSKFSCPHLRGRI